MSVLAQQAIDPIDRRIGGFAQRPVEFGESKQRFALVMGQWLRGRIDSSLDARERAFQPSQGEYQASICHPFMQIAG